MPTLKKIVIQNYRNISLQELEMSSSINCISGGNGEGKTNLLDAIYYLSMTKSAVCPADSCCIRHGCDSLAVSGVFRMESGVNSRFSVKSGRQGKELRRDDKLYQRFSDHMGVLPVVMVAPSDIVLVSESGDERRRFVNSVLSQIDKDYLSAIQQYNRLLLQRNSILRQAATSSSSSDGSLLDVLDYRLGLLSVPIFEKRKAFVEDILPLVRSYYSKISGGTEDVSVVYRSELFNAPLPDILARNRDKDMALRYTSAGIQRDDFIFTMNQTPIRRYGSQGQQKSFLVALKFAQYDIMKSVYGFAPTLLLDDLFDKLDVGRIENLLSLVSGEDFGQIFLSDCDPDRLVGTVKGITPDFSLFGTAGGCFTPLSV